MDERVVVKCYIFSLLLLVSGCAQLYTAKNDKLIETEKPNTRNTVLAVEEIPPTNTPEITNDLTKPAEQRQRIIEIGTGEFTAEPRSSRKRSITNNAEGDITLNFQDADINEFTRAVMGEVLKLNYTIDPEIKGSVTLETTAPVSKDELLSITETILSMNGAAMINDDGFYRIIPRATAARSSLPPTSRSSEGGFGVRIIPLTFIAAEEMQKILEPFLTEGSSIRVDSQRNLLIISGTTSELTSLQETIDIFDVDWLRGMSVGLYPLEHVDPETLRVELQAILSGFSDGPDSKPLGGLVKVLGIERLNSVLVISPTVSALREAEIWVYRLDRESDQAGQRLYVYKLQNSKAVEIAEILGHIFGSSQIISQQKTATTQLEPVELAPGNTPARIGLEESPEPSAPLSQDSRRSYTSKTVSGSQAMLSENPIQIIADDVRNALVVMATPRDYGMVEETIKKLDTVPLQVLLEASIIEVTLTDDLNYGIEWFFKNRVDSNKQGQGLLDLGAAGIGPLAPSFSYTIIDSASNVRLALNALAEESTLNVLSSPTLMVLDNQTARINVGDEIPVPARQSVSNIDPDAPTVNEIQFRKTGVTLTVTPRVNESGLVTMEINQQVSNAVQTTSSSLDAPTIQQREIESVVAINSGQTIVLGGLIQDTQNNIESGIPVLYKIPVIGKLFGQTTDNNLRTELLVLITPRVIRNKNEAKDITDEFRRKLKGITPQEPTGETTTSNPS